MKPSEQLDIEQAAHHLAAVAQIVDSKARFAPTSEEQLSRVSAAIPLSAELVAWYRCAAPMSDVYIRQLGNDLRIAGINELVEAQLGYRWRNWPLTHEEDKLGEWPEAWIVIADEGADPLIADTASPGTPILKDMHGMGRWDPWLLVSSLASYLEAQARWIETCLIDSGFSASWEQEPWNAEGNLAPDIARRLRASLSTILPDDCIRYWLQ